MKKKKLNFFLRLSVSSLFIGYLFLKVEWELLYVSFKQIEFTYYAISTLVVLISSCLIAYKYYLLISGTSISMSYLNIFKINIISRFYGLFLPTAIAPGVVRWYKVTRNKKGRIFFLSSTVFERLTFILILILCGFLPLFFYSEQTGIILLRTRIFPVATLSLLIVCLSISYYFNSFIREFINSFVCRALKRKWSLSDIENYINHFSLKTTDASVLFYILCLSILWQIFFLIRIFLLFKSADLPLDFIDVAWIGSLVLLLQILPISFSGLGVREGAYAYLVTLFNLLPEKGVLIGILFFSQSIILATIGGMFEAISSDYKSDEISV